MQDFTITHTIDLTITSKNNTIVAKFDTTESIFYEGQIFLTVGRKPQNFCRAQKLTCCNDFYCFLSYFHKIKTCKIGKKQR